MSLPARQFLRELLESEEGQQRIEAIWRDVTEKRTVKKTLWGTCRECKHRVELTQEFEVYSLKDAIAFLSFAASYGVGKPPEEKKVEINVTAKRIEELSDDELDAVIEGTARELPAG